MKEYIFERKTELTVGHDYTGNLKIKAELIRCKDCREHREPINMCDIWHHHTTTNGYCHRARHK